MATEYRYIRSTNQGGDPDAHVFQDCGTELWVTLWDDGHAAFHTDWGLVADMAALRILRDILDAHIARHTRKDAE